MAQTGTGGIARPEPRRCTLLELVQGLLDQEPSDEALVASAAGLLRSGEVALTGNFRGCTEL